MDKKVLVFNVPLHNKKEGEPYGMVEFKEIEVHQKEGWQVIRITPVIPNQPGNATLSIIQYLVEFSK